MRDGHVPKCGVLPKIPLLGGKPSLRACHCDNSAGVPKTVWGVPCRFRSPDLGLELIGSKKHYWNGLKHNKKNGVGRILLFARNVYTRHAASCVPRVQLLRRSDKYFVSWRTPGTGTFYYDKDRFCTVRSLCAGYARRLYTGPTYGVVIAAIM